jgi:threonine synthase
VIEGLGEAPDVLAIPVGNAGNISAYWKGFKEFHLRKKSTLPRMFGFEASGAAAIVHNRVFPKPETIATAIRIGNPASWDYAVDALKESNGHIDEVTDEEILDAYRLLAKKEGIFAEPASCASIAGVKKSLEEGVLEKGSKVVAVLTGNGLKDPVTAMENSPIQPVKLPNDKEKVKDYIKGTIGV